MNDLRTAAQQALAFTMRDFASLRDFEAAKAVLQDSIRSALVEEEKAAAWLAERKEHWRKEKEKIQATDPELSAALGWPGGISNPVLDRKVLLQKVAALRLASQQALEALKPMIDLAEFWINHRQERYMSEQEYRVWIALGHESNAMIKARAAIKAVEEGK